MKKITLKLRNGSNDTRKFVITATDDMDNAKVAVILKKEHEYLNGKDPEGIYEIQGKTPETLLDYVCQKYGWTWEPFEFDIDLELH